MQKENKITLLYNLAELYENACKPLCKDIGITHTALSILMFLANNPDHYTAKDICRFRGIKPSIASLSVDKLAAEGYLERVPVKGDRRSVKLVCTGKAQPVIERGRKINSEFYLSLTHGMTDKDMEKFNGYLDIIKENIVRLKKTMKEDEFDV